VQDVELSRRELRRELVTLLLHGHYAPLRADRAGEQLDRNVDRIQ